MTETTRPTTVRVIADHTPGAHRTDSEDLWWWLRIIGPTASALAFLFARHAATGEDRIPRTRRLVMVRVLCQSNRRGSPSASTSTTWGMRPSVS
jgi:hypothetical protein